MSKKANMTLIGVFVTGAVALMMVILVIFGSGKFFKQTLKVQMNFSGSIKGLTEGAPVTFKGVQVGSVTKIQLVADEETEEMSIPVLAELDPEVIVRKGTREDEDVDLFHGLASLIHRGLKAQLQMQSIVTGQLQIGMDFYPERPIVLKGSYPGYMEIPTIATPLEELQKTVADLPLKEMILKLSQTIEGLEKLVTAPETRKFLTEAISTLSEAQQLVRSATAQVDPMAGEVKKTAEAARGTMKQINTTLQTARPALAQAGKTLALKEGPAADVARELKELLSQTRGTLATIDRQVSRDSELNINLQETLREIASMSRSLRELVSYLQQHPESLLTGKNPTKGASR